MSKNVLITGASSGFGKLTAETLLRSDCQVVAAMRDTQGRNKEAAEEIAQKGAHVVEMDVTDEKSVIGSVNKALKLVQTIDVVVNNAGVGVLGIQESFTPEDFQRLFNVNVFGVQRVNRAVLPHMRKTGSGCLIHVSSLLGRMVLPFFGPYNASKWALEALAENYRVELSAFGIDSCIVEPGAYATSFMYNLITPSDKSRDESLGEYINAPHQAMSGFAEALENNPDQDSQKIADAILFLINTPAGERPLRTVVDTMGMGDPLVGYNQQLEKLTHGIYSSFGMADMISIKSKSKSEMV